MYQDEMQSRDQSTSRILLTEYINHSSWKFNKALVASGKLETESSVPHILTRRNLVRTPSYDTLQPRHPQSRTIITISGRYTWSEPNGYISSSPVIVA